MKLMSAAVLCQRSVFVFAVFVLLGAQLSNLAWLTTTTTTTTSTKVTTISPVSVIKNEPPQQQNSTRTQKKIQEMQRRLASLPVWMQEYFVWHQQVRNNLTEAAWKTGLFRPQLFILQCLAPANPKCGGTADRLKPIPLLLLAAYRSKRLFLIRWNRPYPLDSFLQPPLWIDQSTAADHHRPVASLDWRVPVWLQQELGVNYSNISRAHIFNVDAVLKRTEASAADQIVTALIQWHDGGELIYNAQPEVVASSSSSSSKQAGGGGEFRRIYHDLFRLCFEPVPPIAQQLYKIQQTTGLIPGQYVTAQYRAFYREKLEPPSVEFQRASGLNAVNCASQLRPGAPVYFASDSVEAVAAVQDYAQHTARRIITNPLQESLPNNSKNIQNSTNAAEGERVASMPMSESILHLDHDFQHGRHRPVEDYYATFIDLYLMGESNCMSFGEGGFARFGLLLSHNVTCESRHYYRKKMIPCEWADQ